MFTLCVVFKNEKDAHTALRRGPPVGPQDDYMDVLLVDLVCMLWYMLGNLFANEIDWAR